MSSKDLLAENAWLRGPHFLTKTEEHWPAQPCRASCDECEEVPVLATTVEEETPTDKLIQQYSSWHRLKGAVAIYLRFFEFLKHKAQHKTQMERKGVTLSDRRNAGQVVIRYVQKTNFQKEVELKRGRDTKVLPKSSPLHRLDPQWDEDCEVLRVGGRLRRSELEHETKHPILLPKRSHVTELIIREIHERLGHSGRNHVLSSLREQYWVINSNSAVRSILFRCVKCRKIGRNTCKQKMADLPKERVNPSPPFTHTGVDYFGPFTVKEGRKCVKQYGVIFTCFASRAIHLEVASSLDTDSFINALRRFIARRGNVKSLKSDNGTNFVGAEKELKKCITEMNSDTIAQYLSKHEIEWSFNPPGASHMGGVWERQIRTVRKVLAGMNANIDNLDCESFRTLMCEIESIINSRPLTTLTDDPDDLTPLCPTMILTGKKELNILPPGNFQRQDIYSRKRWRRVQQLANVFWQRWKREYLVTLQTRNKETKVQRNAKVGDVVLLVDETMNRNAWHMGKITDVEIDSNGMVRCVNVKTATSSFRRPVSKIILLLEAE
jgi:transposase InsO family protein